jgi:aryl-alcohol dehydrogenase-like predicted oxidoreductase
MGGSTRDGTARYAKRFEGQLSAASFRSGLGRTLSSLGLGTYLGKDDEAADRGYQEAIVAAVQGGINVLDTAVNYRHQHSERAIGAALRELAAAGVRREEVVLATKGGYVPASDPETYFEKEIMERGLARAVDLVAGCHSIAPGYVQHQLELSLQNLGVETVDVYYLHNPEQQLEEVARDEFLARMRAAFEVLEKAVAEGRIGAYGTATWNGYRVESEEPGALSLESLVELARDVAGDGHHFRLVQLPLNIAMVEAFGNPTQSVGGQRMPLLAAAAHLGVTVMTSASILQGRLARLPPTLRDALPTLPTDAQRSLQFARSVPGVTTALVGMSRAAHVAENLEVMREAPLAESAIRALFQEA